MLSSKEMAAIDKKVEKHLSAKAAKVDLKAIWAVARPIVLIARGLLFWKPKWQQVIDNLIAGVDAATA